MPRSTRTRRRCVVTFFDSIWNLALAAVTNERGSYSELGLKRSSSARMPVTAHHAPGEVPLAWQGGRELGAEPDNCVSSIVVANRAPRCTSGIRAEQQRAPRVQ